MSKDRVKLRADHPDRPVDWRWRLAIDIAETGVMPPTVDAFTKGARFFYERMQQLDLETHADELYDLNPGIYVAWSIFSAGSPKRHEIEARILAQEDFDSVARKTAIPRDTLVYYEALFFNVLDRIDAPSYVIHNAVGNIYDADVIDEYSMWKLYGYWCGPPVVDLMVYKQPPRSLFDADSDEEADKLLRAQIQIRVYTLFQQTKLRGTDDLEFALNSYIKLQQLAKDTEGSRVNKRIMDQIYDLLKGINWRPDESDNIDTVEADMEALADYMSNEPLPLPEPKKNVES